MDKSTTASEYHRLTSYERGKMAGHYLDWQNQPKINKAFPGIIPMTLPDSSIGMNKNILSILKERTTSSYAGNLSIKDLSMLLGLTYSLTGKAVHLGETFYYRSAASAGALYPTEIYVQVHNVEGLNDGLYHFALHRHSLYPLRVGDLSGYTSEIISSALPTKPVLTFFFTAIFFRSAWKYQERAYRYNLLDTGHVIENLIIALKFLGLPCRISYNYDDKQVNHLLGLEETREVSLAVIRIPRKEPLPDSMETNIGELSREIGNSSIVSGKEKDYQLIGDIHRAGRTVIYEVPDDFPLNTGPGMTPDRWEDLPGLSPEKIFMDYPDCLFKRRSRRNFVKKSMDKDSLLLMLEGLCAEEKDLSEGYPIQHQAICIGFITGDVEEFFPGLYRLDTLKNRYGLVKDGRFLDKMAHACLDQAWLGNAAVHFLFLSNLGELERIRGARGYRYVMMSAGRLGERIYIQSTSLEMGCCGIGAFYDDETVQVLGLNRDISLLYLVAVGPVKSL